MGGTAMTAVQSPVSRTGALGEQADCVTFLQGGLELLERPTGGARAPATHRDHAGADEQPPGQSAVCVLGLAEHEHLARKVEHQQDRIEERQMVRCQDRRTGGREILDALDADSDEQFAGPGVSSSLAISYALPRSRHSQRMDLNQGRRPTAMGQVNADLRQPTEPLVPRHADGRRAEASRQSDVPNDSADVEQSRIGQIERALAVEQPADIGEHGGFHGIRSLSMTSMQRSDDSRIPL